MPSDSRFARVGARQVEWLRFFVFGAALGCGAPMTDGTDDQLRALAGETQGTTWQVKWRASTALGDEELESARSAIAAELERVDASMSTWREDSELARWNRNLATESIRVSEELAEVVGAALMIAKRTGGAFDPTVSPLVDAWGFGGRSLRSEYATGEPPGLDALLGRVGWGKVVFDRDSRSLGKMIPDLELDLSGIAQGYTVDRISAALLALGLADHFVEVGGEIRVRGEKRPGTPWIVGIESPVEGVRLLHRRVALRDAALATSGDYRSFREVAGRRISHLLDPRTGLPVQHRLASVSVAAKTCMEADALSTALMVLGPEAGVAFAEREGIAALFLVRTPSGFQELTTGSASYAPFT